MYQKGKKDQWKRYWTPGSLKDKRVAEVVDKRKLSGVAQEKEKDQWKHYWGLLKVARE